ncbi:MAG: recombination mediator RecR [bacterium]
MLPAPIQDLIDEFAKLPGIGNKTAQRLAFYLLKQEPEDLQAFATALSELHAKVNLCRKCHNLTENNLCTICANSARDQETICLVETVLDVVAIEHTGDYKGLYHVLHGTLSPIDGIGPDQLKIDSLVSRLENESIKEVIIATNPSMEGEATAMYVAKKIKPLNVKLSRIARGLPVGGFLEYADDITLSKAMENRNEY